jgi:hypothetical protein
MSEASPEEERSEETNFGITNTDKETASYDPIVTYHRACELGWGFNKHQVHVSSSEGKNIGVETVFVIV